MISFQIILEEQNEDLNAKLQTLNISQTSQASKQLYQTMTDIKLQNVSFIVYTYVHTCVWYRPQVISWVLTSVHTLGRGRVTCIALAFPFCVTCNQLKPHENNRVYILLACSRQQPRPRKYTSLARMFLCCMVEYSLFVVNATLFLCCSSVTDHLLSACMPRLSIETRCCIILLFLFSGKCAFFSIQERLY